MQTRKFGDSTLSSCHSMQVFGFVTDHSNFHRYDFSKLTTAAWDDDPEAMCTAHEHGVRVIADGRAGVLDALKNAKSRTEWVRGQYNG